MAVWSREIVKYTNKYDFEVGKVIEQSNSTAELVGYNSKATELVLDLKWMKGCHTLLFITSQPPVMSITSRPAEDRSPTIGLVQVSHVTDNIRPSSEDQVAYDSANLSRSADLEACSETCKNFLKLVRRHIFHTITLSGYGRCTRFADALAFLPEIAIYVRCIYLNDYDDTSNRSFTRNPALASILSVLHNIKVLGVDGSITKINRTDSVFDAVKKELTRLLLSPHLTKLCLAGIINIPSWLLEWIVHVPSVSLVNHSDKLRNNSHLRFLRVGPHVWPSSPIVNSFSPPNSKLEELTVEWGYDILVGLQIANNNRDSLATLILKDYIPNGNYKQLF
ncbi:hypothetical protein BDQ17DRAFT_1325780 [Cyathus striatus]|nr:hypothetical protein BDQ17DRAFT_1325780 [Cyathus striatus]